MRVTVLPSVLLLATLFRLSLNVSTTRLILAQADAGRVVEAFGSFVVSGSLVVGVVVFLILTAVQLIVIARGSERIAEVAARFTLDALPGKQAAIDAELRSGAVDAEGAKRRRDALQTESQLYGALDGAMKFVRGDAIAGLIITFVNIAAGLTIGVVQLGMAPADAVQVYTLLTVGDGLVSILPSVLIATSAGLIVTRVSANEEHSLGGDIWSQLLARPRTLAVTAALLALLALVPGLPFPVFAALALIAGGASWRLSRVAHDPSGSIEEAADPIVVRLNEAAWQSLGDDRGVGALRQGVEQLRESASAQFGVAMPAVRIEPTPDLADAFRVELEGTPVRGAPLRATAPNASEVLDALATAIRENLADFVGVQSVQRSLSQLSEEHPALVSAVVPDRVSLANLTDVLRRLVTEGVGIRNLKRILEAFAELPEQRGAEPRAATLAERARRALRREIAHRYTDGTGRIDAYVLESELEADMRRAIEDATSEAATPFEPGGRPAIAEAISQAIASAASPAVIVTPGLLRPHVRAIALAAGLDPVVLARDELAGVQVDVRGTIG